MKIGYYSWRGQGMKNRVTVTIGGHQYHFVASEGEEYTRKVAEEVDRRLRETMSGGTLALADGAILTAMNLMDEKLKEQEASENLRRQIKELLEESAKLKSELSESKREIFKLTQKK